MQTIVEVLPDKSALIQRSLEIMLTKIEDAIAQRGIVTITLAGGSTPKPLYEKLAEQDLPWGKSMCFGAMSATFPLTIPTAIKAWHGEHG